jgi:erythromycin esterase
MARYRTHRSGDRIAEQVEEIGQLATPLEAVDDLRPLLDRVRDARIVQIGEASHGTADYYRWRADLTRRLIEEGRATFVAVEGDWPDCEAVTEWLLSDDDDRPATRVLEAFARWPTWMWANEEVAEFLSWLKAWNAGREPSARVPFYGLDVYSLWDSLRAVLRWLEENEPESVGPALEAMRCFDPYHEDPQRYAGATRIVSSSCEGRVVELLHHVRRHAAANRTGSLGARLNADVVAGAERYYRAMVRGGGQSWNVRDVHMTDTLDQLLDHHGPSATGVVWAHNTHVGDARATDMAAAGMVNLGQLARERHGDDQVVLIGFASRVGSVVAGSHWGADWQVLPVPEAQPGTHEDLLHQAIGGSGLVVMPDRASRSPEATSWLSSWRGHRAIGVVYDPRGDAYGNWVPTAIGDRYDALLHLDETEALHPLLPADVAGGERETEPWGS